jgi:cell division septum initiation protein DivIVA
MATMTPEYAQDEAMIYVQNEPNVGALQEAYTDSLRDMDEYMRDCLRSYNERRNRWPGKSQDLRKHGANAFPWEGASDMEVNVIGERIDTYVSLLDQALDRSHIKAFPTSQASMARSAVVSSFLKWMRKSYIPDFRKQMELGANYLLEKGMMISYVGWKKERRTYKQTVTITQIQEAMPELADAIIGGDEASAVDMISAAYPEMLPKRVKRAVKDLAKTGVAEVSVPRDSVDCPVVHSCAPDGEVVMPSYCYDPQRSPYIFWRTFYTAQELEKKVTNEGWDEKWVKDAIAKLRGKDSIYYDGGDGQQFRSDRTGMVDENDLVMVVYAYQRLIDEEDGSEGIYCTTFHPNTEGYAKHELLNGYDDYPFVVTRLSNNQRRIYETQTFSDILRGPQIQIKTERDSRIDRASLATLPPMMHPAGRPPSDWGPGRKIPYRRLGELQYAPVPPYDPGSERIEAQMDMQADRAVGLAKDDPASGVRQQFIVNKYLDHVKEVLNFAWKLFQRMGPDEVFFQVTGNPNPQVMTKGDADENFSLMVSFDTRENDPETVKSKSEAAASLLQIDRNGRMNTDKLLEVILGGIDPFLADHILEPAEEAQERMVKDVKDDLVSIYSGIEMDARPNGAQLAMQMIQQYTQQPDVMQRLQDDESFAARLQKYAQQYQFQMQQAQNAQIGRMGTAPAQMGGTPTAPLQE